MTLRLPGPNADTIKARLVDYSVEEVRFDGVTSPVRVANCTFRELTYS